VGAKANLALLVEHMDWAAEEMSCMRWCRRLYYDSLHFLIRLWVQSDLCRHFYFQLCAPTMDWLRASFGITFFAF